MSTPIDNGGPAFPINARDWRDIPNHPAPGMSLRDHFAGQALVGMQARMADSSYASAVADIAAKKQISVSRAIAECCYSLADDMIAVRKERA